MSNKFIEFISQTNCLILFQSCYYEEPVCIGGPARFLMRDVKLHAVAR